MAFKVADRVWETTTTSGTAAIALGGAKNGSTQTLSSVLSNGDEFYYCATDNATVWEVALGTFNTGTPDTITRTAANVIAGSSGPGVLVSLPGTSCDVFLTAPAERTLVQAADFGVPMTQPSGMTAVATPGAGITTIIPRALAGYGTLASIDEAGVERLFERASYATESGKICLYEASGGMTITAIGGIGQNGAINTLGTRNIAPMNPTGTTLPSMRSLFSCVSAATAGSVGGAYSSNCVSIGTGTGQGFFASMIIGCGDAAVVSGAYAFAGIFYESVYAGSSDPGNGCFGITQQTTDATQWYMYSAGSTGQTPVALGTALGAPNDTSTLYQLIMYSPANQNTVLNYVVKNLKTGVSVSGQVADSTGVKLRNTDPQQLTYWRSNNATAAAVTALIGPWHYFMDY